MIGLDSLPRRNQSILARQVQEELILLDPRSGEYYTLDEVGGKIWHLCDGEHTVTEIADAIGQEYDAPRNTIEGDALELLKDLADGHLVALADR
jgi:hypothetical protein